MDEQEELDLLDEETGPQKISLLGLIAGILLGLGAGGAVGAAVEHVFIGGAIGLVAGILLGLAISQVKRPQA
jgi:hypothetical protein